MNCAKILISYSLKRGFYELISPGKHLDRFNSNSLTSFKVNVHSTSISMEDIYDPPNHIRGMKVLDRNVVTKTITVSCLTVDNSSLVDVMKIAKKYLLKILNLKPIQEVEGNKKKILLNVKEVNSWNDLDEKTLDEFKKLNITEDNFCKTVVELKYNNWLHYELLRAILPENEPPLSSFSVIGHIIHLNIKDHLLEYKNLIAEILLDKIPNAKTVVYKKDKINNVYRNFEMEVLSGEPDFIASVKENQCTFKLDFSKVYWNPRLSSEHMIIVNILKERDVLFDVFAGIGPFAIPAAKKKCSVYANDLNPESVKWLNENINLNKRAKGYIKVFNKDGGDFILNDVKENLIKVYEDEDFNGKIHFVMNLPGLAPKFMKYLKGLISDSDFVKFDSEKIKKCLPIVHCYFFTLQTESLQYEFEKESGICLKDVEHSFHFIRKVSNSKSMCRITLTLPFNYLMAEGVLDESEPLPKRICTNILNCKWTYLPQKKYFVRPWKMIPKLKRWFHANILHKFHL